jgi:hypothetical protein
MNGRDSATMNLDTGTGGAMRDTIAGVRAIDAFGTPPPIAIGGAIIAGIPGANMITVSG